jgi:hypothetical protein
MRPLLIAFLPLAFSASAAAQFMPRTLPPNDRMPGISDRGTLPGGEPALGRELRKTRDLIGEGRRNGELSTKEAKALRREAKQIDTLADRYGRDGLSDSERRELDTRVRLLRADTIAGRSRGKP